MSHLKYARLLTNSSAIWFYPIRLSICRISKWGRKKGPSATNSHKDIRMEETEPDTTVNTISKAIGSGKVSQGNADDCLSCEPGEWVGGGWLGSTGCQLKMRSARQLSSTCQAIFSRALTELQIWQLLKLLLPRTFDVFSTRVVCTKCTGGAEMFVDCQINLGQTKCRQKRIVGLLKTNLIYWESIPGRIPERRG